MSKILRDLAIDLEMEGVPPGTPQFERMFRERKVKKCQDLHNVTRCQECVAFDGCDLAKAYLMDLRNNGGNNGSSSSG